MIEPGKQVMLHRRGRFACRRQSCGRKLLAQRTRTISIPASTDLRSRVLRQAGTGTPTLKPWKVEDNYNGDNDSKENTSAKVWDGCKTLSEDGESMHGERMNSLPTVHLTPRAVPSAVVLRVSPLETDTGHKTVRGALPTFLQSADSVACAAKRSSSG